MRWELTGAWTWADIKEKNSIFQTTVAEDFRKINGRSEDSELSHPKRGNSAVSNSPESTKCTGQDFHLGFVQSPGKIHQQACETSELKTENGCPWP